MKDHTQLDKGPYTYYIKEVTILHQPEHYYPKQFKKIIKMLYYNLIGSKYKIIHIEIIKS